MIIRLLKNCVLYLILLPLIMISTMVIYLVMFFVSQRTINIMINNTLQFIIKLTCIIMGSRINYQGLDNIPEGNVIFACKHQSAIETAAFFTNIKKYTKYCYKKEVLKLPFWGRMIYKYGGIRIERTRSSKTDIDKLINQTKEYLNNNNSVIIFPEGTRASERNQSPPLKRGIYLIYQHVSSPIVPVSLNTAKFLPKKSILFDTAIVNVVFHQPIPPNLIEDEMLRYLHKNINSHID